MARYEWPREFRKSPDRLIHREERALRSGVVTQSADGSIGNIDLLDEVIARNFDEDRLWMPLGPHILTNGQATRNPIVSGRTRDIKVSPDGTRAYAGTANGGVWYWTQAHGSWRPLGSAGLAPTTDRSDLSLTVGALLVQFGATEASDIVYAATGEGRPSTSATPGSSFGGLGVLRLKDPLPTVLANQQSNPWAREAENLSAAGFYRLARDPAATFNAAGQGTLVAATSWGLYTRSGAFTADQDWTLVEFLANATSTYGSQIHCSDVVWNDKGLWVTVVGTNNNGVADGLYRSVNGTAGPFVRINLPTYEAAARLSLGEAAHNTDRMYVLGKTPSPVDATRHTGHAQLWLVDLTHNATVARTVSNTPIGLFVSSVERRRGRNFITENDQSDYDQAIAVRQDGGSDKVTVGGSLEYSQNAWNAAIFDLTISINASGAVRTNFRPGNQHRAHRDSTFIGSRIHPDVHSLAWAGADLWVGCDGGVFQRQGSNNARSLNAGLSSVEIGYIDGHPTNDGTLIAGTQDNGSIQRIGDTVWRLERKGDGGGCLFHPTKPHFRFLQYTNADWEFRPDRFRPSSPVFRANSARTHETTESGRAGFYSQAAVARSNNADDARLFIGTDRIWYSANWNRPRRRMNWVTIPTMSDPYRRRNTTQDQLTESASSDPVVAIDIQNEGTLATYENTALLVLCARTVRLFRFTAGAWTSVANSVVSATSTVAAPGVGDPFLRQLPRLSGTQWTDIAPHRTVANREQFYVTTTGSLRRNAVSGDLEADPAMDTLWWYDGSGRWYPTGLMSQVLNATTGQGGSSAPAYSVVVNPDDTNEVYVGNRIGVWRGTFDDSGTHPTWTWQPAMEGLPHTVVQDLNIQRYDGDAFLQAGLVSRGVWERDISNLPTSVGTTFIRTVPTDTGRFTLPDPPLDPRSNRALKLHESSDLILLPSGSHPWDPGLPNEAEMMDARVPRSFRKRVYDGFAMVHHRHTTPVAGADMNIDIFMQQDAPRRGIDRYILTDTWRTAVANTVNGTAAALPAGLTHIGRFNPTSAVDARTPRAVKFSVDLNFLGRRDHVMLIAIVTSPNNGFGVMDLSDANLGDVVRGSAQVAVRMIRRR
ncbi:hypothetical protein MUY35_01235 [Aliiroseovarius sp. S1339]|uniref:hypothetical protein n=1 Tax=Aliiroseovarius sp. S1339 TaxID=2936990 RepID=UPI0020BEF0F3|nr:hypothetical protein [Aliiroseovarius sp. S1339]MCK8462470.1 hypothetical protein [Aliiroseovarius sp. S1339]